MINLLLLLITSSVVIMTKLRIQELRKLEFDSRYGQGIYLSTKYLDSLSAGVDLLIQWIQATISLGVKRRKPEANDLSTPRIDVKFECSQI
jgi:hypothetical protein